MARLELTPLGLKVQDLCTRAKIDKHRLFEGLEDQNLPHIQNLMTDTREVFMAANDSYKDLYIQKIATEITAWYVAKTPKAEKLDPERLQKAVAREIEEAFVETTQKSKRSEPLV